MNIDGNFLRTYFENELTYLRTYFRDVFRDEHPEISNDLGLHLDAPSNPHTKHLVEAFAILTARIHKRLDDSYPQIRNSLMEIVYPEFTRPIPAVGTVQFTKRKDSADSENQVVPAQTVLEAKDIPHCKFRTCQEIRLLPIELVVLKSPRAQLTDQEKPKGWEEAASSVIEMELECRTETGWSGLSNIGNIRFFLGVNSSAFNLYELLFSRLKAVRFESVSSTGFGHSWTLPGEEVLQPAGFSASEAILPGSENSSSSFAMIKEFFAYPEKFLYVDLNLVKEELAKCVSKRLRISFFFKEQIVKGMVLDRNSNFLLQCSPVVNLFEMTTESITLDQQKVRYPVIPIENDYEVFSIEKVTNTSRYEDTASLEFSPFFKSRNYGDRERNYWEFERRREFRTLPKTAANIEQINKCYLSFYGSWKDVRSLEPVTLTVDALCSNRSQIVDLLFESKNAGTKDSDFLTHGIGLNPIIKLLDKPTVPCYATEKEDLQWDMVNLLSLNYLTLCDSEKGAERLRQLLETLNFRKNETTNGLIKSLTNINHRRCTMRLPSGYFKNLVSESISDPKTANQEKKIILKRPVIQGIEITLTFENYKTRAQRSKLFLLGSVLSSFFGQYASINSYTKTVVQIKDKETNNNEESIKWQPKAGMNPIV